MRKSAMTRSRAPPARRYARQAWLVASDADRSRDEKSMRRRVSASSAAAGSENDAPVSAQTTSHAMTLPSAMHLVRAAAELAPKVGLAPKTSSRTLVDRCDHTSARAATINQSWS
jgi:hypothetical protein